MIFGAIVLRDVPKKEARLDLVRHQIQGGFRGFQMVPPGLHYASVAVTDHHVGVWCWARPGEAVIRMFDPQTGFTEDTPDTEAHYSKLALSGAMNQVLIPYDHARFAAWFALTKHITADDFPPTLHPQDESSKYSTRFDKAFLGTHSGNPESFLAEFQFAFLRWLVSLDEKNEDKAAFERWRHLLLASYNVGEDRIRKWPALFPLLVGTILAQFKLLPDDWFGGDSFLTKQVGYLVEDMDDTGIEEVVKSARQFADYLQERQ